MAHLNLRKTALRLSIALLAPFALAAQLHAQELTVSAAASLTNAFQAIGQAFEKAHPGSKITFNFAASGPLLAQIQGKALRPLAVTGARRSRVLPDVPTAQELGVKGLNAASWNGLAVPARTPAAVVEQLNKAVNAALADAGVRELLVTPDEQAEPDIVRAAQDAGLTLAQAGGLTQGGTYFFAAQYDTHAAGQTGVDTDTEPLPQAQVLDALRENFGAVIR